MTFKKTSKEVKEQFMQFMLVFCVAYVIQLIALIFFVHGLDIFEFIAQILAIGVYTIASFFGNYFITFKKDKTADF